jgi:hypothetical protein
MSRAPARIAMTPPHPGMFIREETATPWLSTAWDEMRTAGSARNLRKASRF